VRARIAIFVAIVQSILFLAHGFLYETWIAFWGAPGGTSDPPGILKLQVTLALLSVSFVAASFLAFRYSHILVRLFYTLSAVWLGALSFCFYAAWLCWVLYGAARLFGLHVERRPLAVVLLGLAILASVYGIINASRTRVNRITVKLPNLPESWRGRVAALVSDTHLGHVRNYRFVQRIVSMLTRLRPDVVFIGGDLFDGTAADLNRLTKPWASFSAPLGTYFVTGNHEEFFDRTKYLDAVNRSGVRILNNEKVVLDGLQLVGVHYRDSIDPQRFRSILQQAGLDRGRASILLTHAPHRLPIAEEEGISLQLSGHTHGGQFVPYSWITSRIYGPYVYGLNRFGNLMVYTSSGAGTWGPPLRVGTKPEIVLIRFE
jgi:predicted MPP superfamily phosphohydrolase